MSRPRLKGKFMKAGELDRRKKCSDSLKHVKRLRESVKLDDTHMLASEQPPNIVEDALTSESVNTPDPVNTQPLTQQQSDVDDEPQIVKKKLKWDDGRRIVDLKVLAEGLRTCEDCGEHLDLTNVQSETRQGFASILYIICKCGLKNKVYTSKGHKEYKDNRGPPIFDVNSKFALGVIHAGMGHRQAESLMSTIGIPSLHHKTFKRREGEVASAIHAVADQSCSEALQEEARLSKSSTPGSNIAEGTFKYDMCWQKRGSGRSYDSLTGVGTMIGDKTGKICGYEVKSKHCQVCDVAKCKGKEPPDHQCSRNYEGSSKSMEPVAAVNIAKRIEEQGVMVSTLIMDDDATTIARLRQELSHSITKWSDVMHTKKHLQSALYAMAKNHKGLTPDIIKTFLRWFGYAIAQNKGDVEAYTKAVQQIVPHAFGDHEGCSDHEWCGYKDDPHKFKHKTFPGGRNLSGESLRSGLNAVFKVFITNAERIAPAGTTREVESFNAMIKQKATKHVHYGGSGSLKTRVEASVAQKNLGNNYLMPVNTNLGLSPSRVTRATADERDRVREKRRKLVNTRSFKIKKLCKKVAKKSSRLAKENREGTTYSSNVGFSPSEDDIEEIPPPKEFSIPNLTISSQKKIIFDLETGGFGADTDITQISAIDLHSDNTFNQYVTPTKPISAAASAATGLQSHGGVLMKDGQPMPTLPIKEALVLFIDWLTERGPCILIAHNSKFDSKHLVHHIINCKMSSAFEQCVHGFSDTLPFFKAKHKELENHKQETLVTAILKSTYEAHNALADVKALKDLLIHDNPSNSELSKHAYTYTSVVEKEIMVREGASNVETLNVLLSERASVDGKVKPYATKQIITRIGQSGLALKHLELSFRRGGVDGLTSLLSEVDRFGKPRVTKTKNIIENISSYFVNRLLKK